MFALGFLHFTGRCGKVDFFSFSRVFIILPTKKKKEEDESKEKELEF